jgi:two-component sensor histidine kinase
VANCCGGAAAGGDRVKYVDCAWLGGVVADQYTTTLRMHRGWSFIVDAGQLTVANDIAVPLALVVNELLTNAIQHGPDVEGGAIQISLSGHPDGFSVSVSDPGRGPEPTNSEAGLGTRLVDALVRQINTTVAKRTLAAGYTVTVTVPYHVKSLGTDQPREIH